MIRLTGAALKVIQPALLLWYTTRSTPTRLHCYQLKKNLKEPISEQSQLAVVRPVRDSSGVSGPARACHGCTINWFFLKFSIVQTQ